ncbi:FRG domain-containing protein [Pectobacterium carotovorum]|uniref:FRG domain-containing protein n=2 Tax=Pectobacterium carotovorum TaxID=554 RepID=UPI0030193784
MSILTIINCNTAEEFLDKLTPWNTPYDLSKYVFRGHTDESFKLHPNIMRKKNDPTLTEIANIAILSGKYERVIKKIGITNIKNFHSMLEMTILRRFYRSSNESGLYVPNSKIMSNQMEIDGYIGFYEIMKIFNYNIWLNRDTTEIAALAQHYGLPTRLIDWSYNQYVASFFATNFTTKPDSTKKISLWMLNYIKLSDLFSSSQSDIRIFSPHYQWNANARSQKGLFTYIESRHGESESELVINFLDDCIKSDSINKNSKYKDLYTDYRTLDVALNNAVLKYNNENAEKIDTKDALIKLTLPCTEAIKVNKYLRDMKISEATIFPGYNGVVDDMKSVLRF